jgi:hypothetical protein
VRDSGFSKKTCVRTPLEFNKASRETAGLFLKGKPVLTKEIKKTDKLKTALKVFGVLAVVAYIINFVYAISTSESAGTFGDTFGAANAFFSGSALIMLIYAIVLQREELELVKEERNDTRTLLEGQETINTQQKEALEKQLFEQSFFALVSQIGDERQYLNQRNSAAGHETHLQLAALQVNKHAHARKSFTGWAYGYHTEKCRTFVNLVLAADELLQGQQLQEYNEYVLLETLRAYVDADNAPIILAHAITSTHSGSKLAKTIDRLNCVEHLKDSTHEIAEEYLAPPRA